MKAEGPEKAWEAGDGNCGGAEHGDEAGSGWDTGGKAAAAGLLAKGLAPEAGASNPNPSGGSATWNGDSTLRFSGSFTCFESAASLATEKGEVGFSNAVKGLWPPCSPATLNGESLRSDGWLGRLSKMPWFVFIFEMGVDSDRVFPRQRWRRNTHPSGKSSFRLKNLTRIGFRLTAA